MSLNSFLSFFTQAGHAPFLPDLTLWYRWHCGRQTLPAAWRDATLAEIAAALGAGAWLVEKPWRLEHHGVVVTEREADGERVIRYAAPSGVLVARWSVGPDGDWWQAEYPVKTAEDLPAALEVVKARTYVVESANQQIGESANGGSALRNTQYATRHTPTIRALELPMQPYSDLLHTLFGWGDGLMLMRGEGAEIVQEMLAILAEKLAGCAGEIAALPGDVLLAPDNLDGQYISPRIFKQMMALGYQRTAEIAHAAGRQLIVHIGGPARRLLGPLAEAGVDCVEGVAPAPQSDATLAEARAAAGSNLVLWGGIPQDYLLAARDRGEFEAAVAEAARQAAEDGRTILGVADRVPADADLERLAALPELIAVSARA